MKQQLTLAFILLLCTCVRAQTDGVTLSLTDASISRAEALRQINDNLPVRVFFEEDQLPKGDISLDLKNATMREALDAILKGSVLDFVDYRDRVYVIGSAITIGTEFDAAYYAAVADRIEEDLPETSQGEPAGPTYIGTLESLGVDGLATISGKITDQSSGESFIGR